MEIVYIEDTIRFIEGGEEKASFQEKLDGNMVVLSLGGTISGEINNALLDEMMALIVADQVLVLNFKNVTYLSPSSMEIILKMERKMEEKGKYLRLIEMPQNIYDIFKNRGMHELLEIEVMK